MERNFKKDKGSKKEKKEDAEGENNAQAPQKLYEDEWRTDLTEDIRDAYVVLGYSEELGEAGKLSSVGNLEWDALTDDQREAANFVRYTKILWKVDVEFTTPMLSP